MPAPTTSAAVRLPCRPLGAALARLARAITPARCYCAAIGSFLLIRAVSTLLAGAGYGFPGDGWRAILQLVLGTLLLAAISGRAAARRAVLAVGVIYAGQTVLGLHGHDILGTIPVDMRDRVVHPALAILALVAVAATARRQPGAPG